MKATIHIKRGEQVILKGIVTKLTTTGAYVTNEPEAKEKFGPEWFPFISHYITTEVT